MDEIVVGETAVEAVKRESTYLRGSIAAELANAEPTVSHDAEHLLKFHTGFPSEIGIHGENITILG